MNVVIFGTGLYYERRKNYINNKIVIVAFIDNNSGLWGKEKDGIPIFSPDMIKQLNYDQIVLMSTKSEEMKRQLLELEIEEDKIKYYEELVADLNRGKMDFYFGDVAYPKGKSVLIVVHSLGYHGAPIISSYVARILKKKGYDVVLAATDGDKEFIKRLIQDGFKVVIYGGLHYIKDNELFWIDYFDYIIVNSYHMVNFVTKVSKIKNCIWWLHEPEIIYKQVFARYKRLSKFNLRNLSIFAVSNIARESFNKYYPGIESDLLQYGIPDNAIELYKEINNKKMIFAIIGYVCEIKGQDILVEAIEMLNEEEREEAEFWIIGSIGGNGFCENIIKKARKKNCIKLLGELHNEELENIYPQINVIVNSSREDACPIVVAEGMMQGKVCITTDTTGMAQFIRDGRNGFVCESGHPEDLCQKIKWILSHRESLMEIRKAARSTYEENFSMEKLEERLSFLLEG